MYEDVIGSLKELNIHRRAYLRERTALSNRIFALCYRHAVVSQTSEKAAEKMAQKMQKAVIDGEPYDETTYAIWQDMKPMVDSLPVLKAGEEKVDAAIEKEAKRLPVAGMVKKTKGLTNKYLGCIIAEAGDLNNYPRKGHLWVRMGVGMKYGGRQRKVTDADMAEGMKYVPKRRSLMWQVGCNLIGGMGKGHRPLEGEDIEARTDLSYYERLFMQRLRHEAEKDPDMYLGVTDKGKESYTLHAANRARRKVECVFLRDLRHEWMRQTGREEPIQSQPESEGFSEVPAFMKKSQGNRAFDDLIGGL